MRTLPNSWRHSKRASVKMWSSARADLRQRDHGGEVIDRQERAEAGCLAVTQQWVANKKEKQSSKQQRNQR